MMKLMIAMIVTDSLLDFNDLDIDYLAEDWDEGDEDLDFNELDMDLLDVDFLTRCS